MDDLLFRNQHVQRPQSIQAVDFSPGDLFEVDWAGCIEKYIAIKKIISPNSYLNSYQTFETWKVFNLTSGYMAKLRAVSSRTIPIRMISKRK